jgi:hypothetical protein
MPPRKKNEPVDGGPVSNDAQPDILITVPYDLEFVLRGTSDLLFHRWSNEAVAEKAAAKRGSAVKKQDNLESYVWRDDKGMICLPGQYVHKAMVEAGRFMQDPRSSRRTAYSLFQAAFAPVTTLAPLGKQWEIEDRRRMTVQRQGITRTSPGFRSGWEASMRFTVTLPEYVDPQLFLEALTLAGRVIGVGQYRPTYGRFAPVKFDRVNIV